MRCPLCEYESTRAGVHSHLTDEHPAAVETWTQATSGKMRYRVTCPVCRSAHEATVKPRSHDPAFLTIFGREIRLVAFDMLLNHLEAEHEALPAGEALPPRAALPTAGPGGGRGRPGADGVPLPPGMDEPDLPPWARAAERLKITHHSGSER
jgi:hypothetical protein